MAHNLFRLRLLLLFKILKFANDIKYVTVPILLYKFQSQIDRYYHLITCKIIQSDKLIDSIAFSMDAQALSGFKIMKIKISIKLIKTISQ